MAFARVYLSVLILTSLKYVSASYCSDMETIMNCNDCIKCGGYWCDRPLLTQTPSKMHCSSEPHQGCEDDWMAKDVLNMTRSSENPKNIETEITVGVPHQTPLYSSSARIEIKFETAHNFSAVKKQICESQDECVTVVEAVAGSDFCSAVVDRETVVVKIQAEGVNDVFTVKYRVQCTCPCSKVVQQKSTFCNNQGNYTCGVCSCEGEWTGENCEKYCEIRGDQSDERCFSEAKPGVKCSGNGVCGPCQPCDCFKQGEGSQYFDPDYQCIDICTNVNFYCDGCLRNSTYVGACSHACNYPLSIQQFNNTLLDARNAFNKKVWIRCNETVDECQIEYAAMRGGNQLELMIIKDSCRDTIVAGFGNSNKSSPSLPLILGILVATVILVAGAAVGYKLWTGRAGGPSTHSAKLSNFDALGSTVENPTYKAPISSYKNPTYDQLL